MGAGPGVPAAPAPVPSGPVTSPALPDALSSVENDNGAGALASRREIVAPLTPRRAAMSWPAMPSAARRSAVARSLASSLGGRPIGGTRATEP